MSTPVAHTLAGIATAAGAGRAAGWRELGVAVAAANLPDLDIIPGMLQGSPSALHQQWTHSLGFVALVTVLSVLVMLLLRARDVRRFAVIIAVALTTHLAIDLAANDTSYPYGIQLFWPVSTRHVDIPVTVFRPVSKSSDTTTFIPSLFTSYNAKTVAGEAVIMTGILITVLAVRKAVERK